MTEATHGILVGYDGSPGSDQALGWALQEASWRGAALTICHAWAPEYVPGAPGEGGAPDRARRTGEQVLAQALRFARTVMGAAVVRPLLATGPAAQVLCRHSLDADLVVVGSRGRGGLAGLLLGSVSQQVAAHAQGRVVVVRGHWHRAAEYTPGPVAVGADGSAATPAAIGFAAREAALHGVPLLAVCALADAPGGLGGTSRMEEAVGQDIARWEKEHPEVAIRQQVSPGQPRTALLAAARDAQLLVVGSRGRGGVPGMRLGSVSQAMLHHSSCPVAVVRWR